jgi:uncharacterized protein YdhG (YjbR/CyaY superfamily)
MMHEPTSSHAKSSIEAYIAHHPVEVQTIFRAVWATACAAAPEAEQRMSYRMPALFQHGVVVYVGAFKHHLGIYPPVSEPSVRQRVAAFAGPKGNLQFPYAQPMPLELIADVVQARLAANLAKPGPSATAGRPPGPSAGSLSAVDP